VKEVGQESKRVVQGDRETEGNSSETESERASEGETLPRAHDFRGVTSREEGIFLLWQTFFFIRREFF